VSSPLPGGAAVAEPAAAPSQGPVLSVRGVTKAFGGVRANSDVTFDVPARSVTALIGPNGAGKTTLFNAMTGFGRADSGSVVFAGRDVTRMAPHRIARLGMVRTFQSIRMFADLTVYESLLVPRQPARGRHDRAASTLARLGLEDVANRVCTTLPLLAQRKVEVARALMCEPKVILLDEPTAGATVSERQELASLVAALRASGTTVVVIEHHVPFVMSVSDKVVVLHFGRVVADGPPAEVASNPVVQEIYLGG
jgi:ABC-type branched-subunit amino acid transport system ATPase component